ncbi:MAG: L-2-amino-thiazoline-4-carboxylic acid hydrolase [Eubacteriales bacterium]|nr:L-2-amino-thiazoline-4-carboxylic acid hydrolase [Eubacteriales bacterium]
MNKNLKAAMIRFMQKRYPEQEVKMRWRKIEKQYAQWLAEEGDLGGKKNWMSSNMLLCYLMCAFYDGIDRKLSQEEFLEIFYDAMNPILKMMSHFDMNKLQKKKWLMHLLNRYLKKYEKKSNEMRGREWGNTWKVRVNPDNRQSGIAYVLDTCPLYEFAIKHDYMEVLPFMCASDHLVANAFHAHLIRHKTLSDGDDACEYWYVGDRSTEAKSDPGSK